jgi:hypothetical protein
MKMAARRSLLALALIGGIGAGAAAQPVAVDRARVRGEAAVAVATGSIPRGELSWADRVAPVAGAGRSRAEVRTQTLAAMAQGLIPRGESDAPAVPFESTRSRAEVKAETRVAVQLQLIPRGEAPARDATARELELIRLAGERARAQQVAVR